MRKRKVLPRDFQVVFVFENGNTMFVKAFIPPEGDAVAEFEHFVAIAKHRNYIGEIKRPQPPWPKGALD